MQLARRFKEIFRSAFTELSFPKRWLLRAALLLLLVGGGATALAAAQGSPEAGETGWRLSALTSGAGCLIGFLVGAAFRVFLKLALILGIGVAALLWGLSALGWVELPWGSFGEISGAVASYVHEQSSSLRELMTGWLPASGFSGLGLAAGVTQRPDTDPDD